MTQTQQATAVTDQTPDHSTRAVLGNTAFRRLWLVLGLSSLGDWLGLLAVLAFAFTLAGGDLASGGLSPDDLVLPSLAVSGVFVLRLAPALLLGPLAGVLADRLDRRLNLVVGDVVRGGLFLSIPLVGTLEWLYVATVLVEIAALFWSPAKDAMVPNLVPRRQLEAANQLGVVATYGTAPIAAVLFAGLVLTSNAVDNLSSTFAAFVVSPVDLALYVNGVTFLAAAVVIARLPLPESARGPLVHAAVTDRDGVPPARPSLWGEVLEGWSFIVRTPVVRGLVLGMLGAFAAAGFVIALGLLYVAGLGAGLPGFGALFGAVFVGMALGVWQGPRTLRDMSRRRLFAASIAAAGAVLVVVGLSPDIVLSVVGVALLGFFAGVAWVSGMTLLGGEVEDAVRGRTFAFVQTSVRIVLILVMAAGPVLASRVFGTREVVVTDALTWTFSGAGTVLALAGGLAVLVGVLAFRELDDRPDLSLRSEVLDALRRGTGDPFELPRPHAGFFLVIEGGDGSGKSTLAAGVRDWLVAELGHDVVVTREPGGTAVGARIRELVLDWDDRTQGPGPVPRAEALLFAADRAQHVQTKVLPALADGRVVVGDRYVDSSLAYQGARGDLQLSDVARLSEFATAGLTPDLTVVLDVDPVFARSRLAARDGVGGADRLEAEGEEFHVSVRRAFLDRAARDGRRYLVVDATLPVEELVETVGARLRRMLPLSAAQRAAMAERLAADERSRRAREEVAIAEATAEAEARARMQAEIQQAAEREALRQEEQAAARAELRRLQLERARQELRDGDTQELQVVPRSARWDPVPGTTPEPVAREGDLDGWVFDDTPDEVADRSAPEDADGRAWDDGAWDDGAWDEPEQPEELDQQPLPDQRRQVPPDPEDLEDHDPDNPSPVMLHLPETEGTAEQQRRGRRP